MNSMWKKLIPFLLLLCLAIGGVYSRVQAKDLETYYQEFCFPSDRSMLVNDILYFPDFDGNIVFDDDLETKEKFKVKMLDVQVKNVMSDDEETHAYLEGDNEKGWALTTTECPGDVQINYSYYDYFNELCFGSFEISVKDEIYSIDLNTYEGRNCFLPYEMIAVYATVSREYYNYEDGMLCYEVIEYPELEWLLEGDAEAFDWEIDEENHMIVNFMPANEKEDYCANICVKSCGTDASIKIYNLKHFTFFNQDDFPIVDLGEEFIIHPEVIEYDYCNPNRSESMNHIMYCFEYDPEVLEINCLNGGEKRKEAGWYYEFDGLGVFSIRRISNAEVNCEIAAFVEADGEFTEIDRKSIHMEEIEYYLNMYNVPEVIFENEEPFSVYAGFDDIYRIEDVEVNWNVGYFNEEDGKFEIKDLPCLMNKSEDQSLVEFNVQSLFADDEVIERGGIEIMVSASYRGQVIVYDHHWIEAGREVYHYERLGEKSMLPFWGYDLYNIKVWVRDAMHPYGEDMYLPIVDLQLENVDPEDEEEHGILFGNVDDGWRFEATDSFGDVRLNYIYRDLNGELKSDSCVVHVVTDYYHVILNTDCRRSDFLPGETFEIVANVRHERFTDDRGHHDVEMKDFHIEWEQLNENARDWFSWQPDEKDSHILHVKTLSAPGCEQWGISADFKANLYIDGKEINCGNISVLNSNHFYEIALGEYDNMHIGAEQSIYPECREYDVTNPDRYSIMNNIMYHLEYGETLIDLCCVNGGEEVSYNEWYYEESQSAEFLIHRKCFQDYDIVIYAELDDGFGSYDILAQNNYHFDALNYDISFESFPDLIFAESDPREVTVNMYNLDNVANIEMEWLLGYYNDDQGTFETRDIPGAIRVSEDDRRTAFLDGRILGNDSDVIEHGGIELRAVVYLNGYEVARETSWLTVKSSSYNYELIPQKSILPGKTTHIAPDSISCFVIDENYPYGENICLSLLNMSLMNNGLPDSERLVKVLLDENGGWDIQAGKDFGTEYVEYTYLDIYGNECTDIFKVEIKEVVTTCSVETLSGTKDVLPGEELCFKVNVVSKTVDEDGKVIILDNSDIEYEWYIDDCTWILDGWYDPEDRSVYHVIAGWPQFSDVRVPIDLCVLKNTSGYNEIIYKYQDYIHVISEYQVVVPVEFGATLTKLGSSEEMNAEFQTYSLSLEDICTVNDARFRIEFDPNEFTVFDRAGNIMFYDENGEFSFTEDCYSKYSEAVSFLIYRHFEKECNITLVAETADSTGNFVECGRRDFSFDYIDTSIRFEEQELWHVERNTTLTQFLDISNYSEAADTDFDIIWTVVADGEDFDSENNLDSIYSANKDSIVLDGNAFLGDEYLRQIGKIRIRAQAVYRGRIVAEAYAEAEVPTLPPDPELEVYGEDTEEGCIYYAYIVDYDMYRDYLPNNGIDMVVSYEEVDELNYETPGRIVISFTEFDENGCVTMNFEDDAPAEVAAFLR